MAGMFCSLQQAAEKLNMTEQQVEQLVNDGKLPEIRDGANVYFKIAEVEALMAAMQAVAPVEEAPATPPEPAAPSEPAQDDMDIALFDSGVSEPAADAKLDDFSLDSGVSEPKAEAELDDFSLDSGSGSEISLGTDLGDEDTVAGGEGINILGESDDDDIMSVGDPLSATASGSGEASLEEIEEDVNLDTFGSGSGLLDLSLQADDTSLGGILDEIYTSEGEQETGESSALDFGGGEGEPGLPDSEAIVEAEEPVIAMVPMGQMAIEAAPDTMSNVMGIVLILPWIAVIFTAIVAVAGLREMTPSLLGALESMGSPYGIHIIWYIMGGVAVVSGLIMGGAAMAGGGGSAKPKKEKVKKAKTPKPKKKKKPKKTQK